MSTNTNVSRNANTRNLVDQDITLLGLEIPYG